MSHSLRAKIKGLRYKGIITDKDCDRLCKALDNEDVLDKIRNEITMLRMFNRQNVIEIIDKYKAESKEKSNCSTCANANNVVVCPYTIKDIAAEEGCKFWHEAESEDKE